MPDRRRRLSEGALVEASIAARVMGIRLLTIDATIAIVAADVSEPSAVAHDRPARTTTRSRRVTTGRPSAAGEGLARAVRSIDEGAQLLAEASRPGRG